MRSEEAQQVLDIDYDDIAALAAVPLSVDDYRDQWRGGSGGFTPVAVTGGWDVRDSEDDTIDTFDSEIEAWQFAYEQEGQEEPDACEALEHWIVDYALADWLEMRGEAICKDFAGLTIWGRTTSGQAIAMDHVIASMVAERLDDETALTMLKGDKTC